MKLLVAANVYHQHYDDLTAAQQSRLIELVAVELLERKDKAAQWQA